MAETQDWFAANAPSTPPPPRPAEESTARAEIRRPIASGRGTQFDPTLPNRAVDVATTPLARPTGIDTIDSFTSPVGLASLAAGGAGIVRAGVSGGAMAGARAALETATPVVKYEATKTMLVHLGVPTPLATVVATAVSGYKRGAKPTAAEAEAAAATTAPTAVEAASPASTGPVTPAARLQQAYQQALAKGKGATSPVESVPGGTPPPSGPPPAAAPVSSTVIPGQPPTPQLLPNGTSVPPATAEYYSQKFLNEVAIQARRQKVTLGDADYAIASKMTAQGATPQQAVETIAQARTAPPPSAPAGPAKPHLAASEAGAYLKLRQAGKSHQEAMAALQAMRAMSTGLPSSAEVAANVAARNQTGRWPE